MATSYYHYDGLGSTRQLTDENETITDTYTYDAWGELVASTGTTTNPFRWVGRVGYYWDDTASNYYVRARNYPMQIGVLFMRYYSIAAVILCAFSGCFADSSTTLAQTDISQAAEAEKSAEKENDDVDGDEFKEFLRSLQRPSWDYEKLEGAADVIVIATLEESTTRPDADYRGDIFSKHPPEKSAFVSIDSRFNVKGVLKGEGVEDNVTIAHLKWKRDIIVLSGTRLVTFHKEFLIPWLVDIEIEGEPRHISGSKSVKKRLFTPEYLLFLKRRDDGLLELVSGQRNATASVRVINLF